jgi:hypothetical protein
MDEGVACESELYEGFDDFHQYMAIAATDSASSTDTAATAKVDTIATGSAAGKVKVDTIAKDETIATGKVKDEAIATGKVKDEVIATDKVKDDNIATDSAAKATGKDTSLNARVHDSTWPVSQTVLRGSLLGSL